jgi:4'-phosphopantetheinyl transferase
MAMKICWLQRAEPEVPAHDDWLCANELLRLRGMRFAKRRADWRLGRWTAKCAVASYLGRPIESGFLSAIEIRQSLLGAPQVVLGDDSRVASISLSHRTGTAMCAIGSPGIALGCDLETIEPRSDAFLADYFTLEEQRLVSHAPASDRAALVALLWSAKESALKALLQGLRLDTRSLKANILSADQIWSGHLSTPPATNAQDSSTSCASRQYDWFRLQVHYLNGERTFHGWWRCTGNLVWTLVAESPLLPPVLLDHHTYQAV